MKKIFLFLMVTCFVFTQFMFAMEKIWYHASWSDYESSDSESGSDSDDSGFDLSFDDFEDDDLEDDDLKAIRDLLLKENKARIKEINRQAYKEARKCLYFFTHDLDEQKSIISLLQAALNKALSAVQALKVTLDQEKNLSRKQLFDRLSKKFELSMKKSFITNCKARNQLLCYFLYKIDSCENEMAELDSLKDCYEGDSRVNSKILKSVYNFCSLIVAPLKYFSLAETVLDKEFYGLALKNQTMQAYKKIDDFVLESLSQRLHYNPQGRSKKVDHGIRLKNICDEFMKNFPEQLSCFIQTSFLLPAD